MDVRSCVELTFNNCYQHFYIRLNFTMDKNLLRVIDTKTGEKVDVPPDWGLKYLGEVWDEEKMRLWSKVLDRVVRPENIGIYTKDEEEE